MPRAASATGAPRPHTAAVDRCVASLPPSAWGGGGGGLLEMRPFSGGGLRSGSASRLGTPSRPSSSWSSSSSAASAAATRFVAAGGAPGLQSSLQSSLQSFRAVLAARPGSSCKMREQATRATPNPNPNPDA